MQDGMHGNEAEWKPVVEERRDARQRVQCHIKVGGIDEITTVQRCMKTVIPRL